LLNYTFRKLKKVESRNSGEFPRDSENDGIPGNSRSGIPGGPEWNLIVHFGFYTFLMMMMMMMMMMMTTMMAMMYDYWQDMVEDA